jgi:hypothetical protein
MKPAGLLKRSEHTIPKVWKTGAICVLHLQGARVTGPQVVKKYPGLSSFFSGFAFYKKINMPGQYRRPGF